MSSREHGGGGPAPGARLRTISSGALALAALACVAQAADIGRAFERTGYAPFDQLSFAEHLIAFPPSTTPPLLALAAVVFMLLLPAAPDFARRRASVGLLVVTTCVVNGILSLGYFLLPWPSFDPNTPGDFFRASLYNLPSYAVSVVALFVVISWRGWDRGRPKPLVDEDEPFRALSDEPAGGNSASARQPSM